MLLNILLWIRAIGIFPKGFLFDYESSWFLNFERTSSPLILDCISYGKKFSLYRFGLYRLIWWTLWGLLFKHRLLGQCSCFKLFKPKIFSLWGLCILNWCLNRFPIKDLYLKLEYRSNAFFWRYTDLPAHSLGDFFTDTKTESDSLLIQLLERVRFVKFTK